MWDMCQMLNIWHISHTKPNLSPFSKCGIWYIFCNIQQYCDKFAMVWNACGILFILCLFLFLSHIPFIFSFNNSSPPPSPLSHISLCSSPLARSIYVPPSPLSHTLSSSLYPFALFSSHSWIWATTDFLSTITDLIFPFIGFFFPPFVCSLLFVLSQSRLSGCGFVTSDCGFVTSDCDWRGSLGCGYLLSVLSWVVDSLFVILRVLICCSISEGFIDSPWAKLVSSIRSTSTAYR